MFAAKVILGSFHPGHRPIYTVEACYPRMIHSEVLTHRDKCRNAASSRAIPWKRFKKDIVASVATLQFKDGFITQDEYADLMINKCMYKMIATNPFVPIKWGAEQTGMQTGDEVSEENRIKAEKIWLNARNDALQHADALADLGIHKSLCNRLTEPFMFITTLLTATEWKNFFRLRVHKDAEIHFQKIAGMIQTAINEYEPQRLEVGEWHLPYIEKLEINLINLKAINEHKDATELAKYISAGRCARLSYLTHDGKRDLQADVDLTNKLINRTDDVLHASPLEHTCQVHENPKHRSGPIVGYHQFRKDFAQENVEA